MVITMTDRNCAILVAPEVHTIPFTPPESSVDDGMVYCGRFYLGNTLQTDGESGTKASWKYQYKGKTKTACQEKNTKQKCDIPCFCGNTKSGQCSENYAFRCTVGFGVQFRVMRKVKLKTFPDIVKRFCDDFSDPSTHGHTKGDNPVVEDRREIKPSGFKVDIILHHLVQVSHTTTGTH